MSPSRQESGASEACDAVGEVRRQLADIATDIEVNELPGGMLTVDFSLYEWAPAEQAMHHDDPTDAELEYIQALIDSSGDETLQKAAERLSTEELRSGNIDMATQRSGGLFKSSLVLDRGTVVEFNFRYPPVREQDYTEMHVLQQIRTVAESARCQRRGDTFTPEYTLRPNIPTAVREDFDRIARQNGFEFPHELCPHIRSAECSQSPERIMEYLKRTISEYDWRFPSHREWATGR